MVKFKYVLLAIAGLAITSCSTINSILGTSDIENALPSEQLELRIIGASLVVKAAATSLSEAVSNESVDIIQAQKAFSIIKEAEGAVLLANEAYQNGVGDGASIYSQMDTSINIVLTLVKERFIK